MTGRVTHGHTRGKKFSREYMSWVAMVQRCTNQNSANYPRYGGRGISVCDRWRESFEGFLEDMGLRPEGMTLDRIDNDGNYELRNCRWATALEQAANRTRDSFRTNSRKTRCPAGHPYAGRNLRVTRDGGRKCKECDRLRSAERRARLRAGEFAACLSGTQQEPTP